MLEFVKGDIFDIPVDIRVNTVNCVGVMGAGVALAFKQRYPDMFKDYRDDCKHGHVRPGTMHVWKSLSGEWVVNFPTKRDWREPSRYEDIDAGLDDLRGYLDSVGPVTVALPALGCGNGGLDWSRVSSMIREKLDGVNAHVFVFEPAASHRAAESSLPTTDDERRSAEQLGYVLLEGERSFDPQAAGPLYVLGRQAALARKWIALLPSRAPSEREIKALSAIALELSQSKVDATVALAHGTKVSEEIADLFAQQGVDTILLLPFGVLTRKALAKKVVSKISEAPTIASAAPASAKWSRQLFAQTMDILRIRAAAVLLSDPEPDWLTSKGLDKWGQVPISYVRYERTPPPMREALSKIGAKPIGRRGDTGAPNIEYLVEAFPRSLSSVATTDDPVVAGRSMQESEPDHQQDTKRVSHEVGETLTVTLDQLSEP
ncbi:macro domain-containing protein [Rhizobium leguminosarum]|uniref:macro domain-containing protein n=1 Tax=Rhizobium leguminosarum TaxID=384 RepID=UPI001C942C6B|nr:macro domain-containing protein [Rhizobium leguminosarum]MBY5780157.1 macro domain-containing protein [Rhizobium leguminosarum]